MAPRRRKAIIEEAPIQPPPTSFLSLPDIAHGCIASFLPDGNKGNESRLRTAEATRALFESYGGTLNNISLQYREDSSAARFAALLRRNNELAYVILYQQEAIPAFCLAIVQGCCRGVERIDLYEGANVMMQALQKSYLRLHGAKLSRHASLRGKRRILRILTCG